MKHYDLIVLGGGIQGACLFWEAASRGLKVLLIEKNDFGSGTSANSLKTIHGGLRQLQSLNLASVRAYSEERRLLSFLAPHLLTPLPCMMLTRRTLTRNKWVMGLAMKFYDLLTSDRNKQLDVERSFGPSHILPRTFLQNIIPGLHQDITGAATWFDAQVHHPERLVLAFILSGCEKGGDALHYSQLVSIDAEYNEIRGVHIHSSSDHQTYGFEAPVLVDCTGPWSNDTQQYLANWMAPFVKLTRAVNFVINQRIAEYAIGIQTYDPQTNEYGHREFRYIPHRY